MWAPPKQPPCRCFAALAEHVSLTNPPPARDEAVCATLWRHAGRVPQARGEQLPSHQEECSHFCVRQFLPLGHKPLEWAIDQNTLIDKQLAEIKNPRTGVAVDLEAQRKWDNTLRKAAPSADGLSPREAYLKLHKPAFSHFVSFSLISHRANGRGGQQRLRSAVENWQAASERWNEYLAHQSQVQAANANRAKQFAAWKVCI